MRKKLFYAGIAMIVVGVILFEVGPTIFKSNLNLNELFPLNETAKLDPTENFTLGKALPGNAFVAIYNDSLGRPLSVKATGGVLQSQRVNGTFAAECINTGSSSATVYLINNQTTPVSVNYSSGDFSVTGMLYSIGLVIGGALIAIVGFIVMILGLVLKAKKGSPNAT